MSPERAQPCHVLPGRMRLRIPARRHDTAYFADVERHLSHCDGVEAIETSALTASVLIRHVCTADAITAYALEHGLFTVEAGNDAAPARRRHLATRNAAAPGTPDETAEGNGMLTASLAGLGILQSLRGQFMAPGLTLLWYAYHLWRTRPTGRMPPSSLGP